MIKIITLYFIEPAKFINMQMSPLMSRTFQLVVAQGEGAARKYQCINIDK